MPESLLTQNGNENCLTVLSSKNWDHISGLGHKKELISCSHSCLY